MTTRPREMNTPELLDFVRGEEIDEPQAIEILTNPFCNPEVALSLAERSSLMSSQRVCSLVCMVEGLPLARVADLIAILGWSPTLQLAQAPKTPPGVKRLAERRLLLRLTKMTLGERIALARRAHRVLFTALAEAGDAAVFDALLDNPKMTEPDLLAILNRGRLSGAMATSVLRNARWSRRPHLMAALIRGSGVPMPLLLSAMAQLPLPILEDLVRDPRIPGPVRDRIRQLIAKRGSPSTRTVLR